MKHIYAIFYLFKEGKKTQHMIAEVEIKPTKIVSISGLDPIKTYLNTLHPQASSIDITGFSYLRSHED